MTKQHNFTIHRTRFAGIGYMKQDANLWRFVDLHDKTPADFPTVMGEQFRTKAELLAELPTYAREVWGYA